jgi:hypothetical protein
MVIIEVCSDINNIDGGVGTYAKRLICELANNIAVDSVVTEQLFLMNRLKMHKSSALGRFIKRMTSFELCSAFLKICKRLQHDRIDCVLIESLFQDRNPLIFLFYAYLLKVAHRHNTLVAFSVHEFFRLDNEKLGYYSKFICKMWAMRCDILFVTEKRIYDYFRAIRENVFIRDIPSNIIFDWHSHKKIIDGRKFVYFGFVGLNAAFEEMITAWKKFNRDKRFSLDILTSSEIKIDSAESYKITVKKNLSNEQVAEEMSDKTFWVLPIFPYVGEYNTTFKASMSAGCISIGCFDKKFRDLPFIIPLKNYGADEFVDGLEKAVKMSREELLDKSRAAIAFGNNYSFKKTAEQIIAAIQTTRKQRKKPA